MIPETVVDESKLYWAGKSNPSRDVKPLGTR
jgi:hypothetical protein